MTNAESPEDLNELLENHPDEDIRGQLFALPNRSLRAEQPLFPHQDEAIRAFEANGASGIIHLPTGAGKTRVAIEIIARRLRNDPRERILWASHPIVLIRQAMVRVAELASLFPPGTRMQWLQPGDSLNEKEILDEAQISFLMRDDLADLLGDAGDGRVTDPPLLQALKGRVPAGCPRVTLIYDECHQLGAEGLQKAWYKFQRQVSPGVLARLQTIGFSATPLPTNPDRHELLKRHVFPVRGATTRKPDWEMLVHASIDNAELVRKEILCPINLRLQEAGLFDIPDSVLRDAGVDNLRPPSRSPTKKDLKDFADRFNSKVLGHDAVLKFLARRLASNYRTVLGKTLVFVPTIDAANRLTHYLKAEANPGDVTMVHSKLDEFSEAMLDDADASAVEVQRQTNAYRQRRDAPCIMVNVGMLTTGFDDPKIRTVVLARLTFSTNLFWQMVGRGTRGLRCGGTQDCMVVDPVRLTEKFSVLDGYRPRLDPFRGASVDLFLTDTDSACALDPRMPTVRGVVANATDLPAISPELRSEVAEALRAFLRGGPLTDRVAREVTVRTVIDGDLLREEFGPADGATSSGATWAPIYAVDRLQAEMRTKDPSVDLSWLKTAHHLPPTLSSVDMQLFERKLALIRTRAIKTEGEFQALLLATLSGS